MRDCVEAVLGRGKALEQLTCVVLRRLAHREMIEGVDAIAVGRTHTLEEIRGRESAKRVGRMRKRAVQKEQGAFLAGRRPRREPQPGRDRRVGRDLKPALLQIPRRPRPLFPLRGKDRQPDADRLVDGRLGDLDDHHFDRFRDHTAASRVAVAHAPHRYTEARDRRAPRSSCAPTRDRRHQLGAWMERERAGRMTHREEACLARLQHHVVSEIRRTGAPHRAG